MITHVDCHRNPNSDGYDMPNPTYRMTAPDVETLAPRCPRLTSLSLTLKRSLGDRTETRCYEAIGMLLLKLSV